MAIGRWGWLHVRTLVEEHEQGACLFRIRARLRPSFVGTLQGVTLAVLMAGGMSAAMFIYDLSVTLLVAAAAIAAIGARAAWQAIRATAVLDRAVTRVCTAAGLLKLPVSPTLEPKAEATAEATAGPTVEPVTEPAVKAAPKPALEPAAEAAVEPAAEAAVEPAAEAAVEAAAESTVESPVQPRVAPTPRRSAKTTASDFIG